MKKAIFMLATLALAGIGITEKGAGVEFNPGQYAPERHERFYQPNDSFLGGTQFGFAPNAWAGIGRVTQAPGGHGINKFVTMISDRYFVSVQHKQPRTGDVITFWRTNDPADTATYVVDDLTGQGLGGRIIEVAGDLALGRLTAPVSPDISRYPILDLQASELLGRGIYIVGVNKPVQELLTRFGRNLVEASPPGLSSLLFHNRDNPGIGQDEAQTADGDSGGPTFVISNGTLALVGVHHAIAANSGNDVLLSFYLEGILANMIGETPTIITEPSVIPGDMDFDHDTDFDDIAAFAFAINSPQEYQATYQRPPSDNGDFDADDDVDFDDIEGFVDALSLPPPPPPSLLLGDMDFDADADFDDNDDFVQGLNSPSTYALFHGGFPPTRNGDLDGDGDLDFDEIALFLRILNPPPAQVLGDMDFDGDVDVDDIDDFILGLTDPRKYFYENGNLESVHGDMNQDGEFDFDDIQLFAAEL